MDNNVPPNNTLLVVDALIKANKDFDLLMLPNQAHGYGSMSNYMMRRRWDYFVQVPDGRGAAEGVPAPADGACGPWRVDGRKLRYRASRGSKPQGAPTCGG